MTTNLQISAAILVVLMRKEDKKFRELIEILHLKQVLTAEDVKRLFDMEPFPSLGLM